MSNVTLAVWGLGSIGIRHATNGLALGADVVGYDIAPHRRNLLTNIGGRAVENRDASLESADAVVICTPSGQHLDDIKTAVSARKAILVEKPIADRIDGLEDALNTARRSGLTIATGFNLRFHPAVVHAKQLLDDQTIGKLLWGRFIASSFLPDWRPHQDYRAGYASSAQSGGVIFDYIHEIDLALYLIGEAEVETAFAAQSGILQIASEDVAVIGMRHANGAVTSLHLDYVSRPALRRFEITGTKGRLAVDLIGRRLECLDQDGSALEDHIYGGGLDEDYVAEMDAFLRSLKGLPTALADADAGAATLRAALAARRLCGLPIK